MLLVSNFYDQSWQPCVTCKCQATEYARVIKLIFQKENKTFSNEIWKSIILVLFLIRTEGPWCGYSVSEIRLKDDQGFTYSLTLYTLSSTLLCVRWFIVVSIIFLSISSCSVLFQLFPSVLGD